MEQTKYTPIYAVDFDGTLSVGAPWPEIGRPNEELFGYLISLRNAGARIILWSCRTGKILDDAIEFCEEYGLTFDAVNENLPEIVESFGGDSRKVFANFYIDDKNLCFLEQAGIGHILQI